MSDFWIVALAVWMIGMQIVTLYFAVFAWDQAKMARVGNRQLLEWLRREEGVS